MKFRPCLSRILRSWLCGLVFLCSGSAAVAFQDIDILINGNAVFDGGTHDFGTVNLGTTASRTVTIRNVGDLPLTGFGITRTGGAQSDYSNTQPTAVSLQPGQSTSFLMRFAPLQTGQRDAEFLITSNDPNETPYNIRVTGIGAASPDIAVSQAGTGLTDGSSTVNFGKVNVGATAVRTFSIRNNGLATLSNLSVQVNGGVYSASALGQNSLASSQSTTFTVSFTPNFQSEFTGSLIIFSNDPDENPFNVSFTGRGSVPVLNVEYPPGTLLYDSADTLRISAPVGVASLQSFTVTNVSGGMISGLAVTVDGDGGGDYTVTTPLPATLDADASATFTLSYKPAGLGELAANIHVASDQLLDDPFDIYVLGTGVTLPADGDEDGDGAANMLEIATGQDPLTPGPHPGVLVKNGADLVMTFPRSVAALADTTLTVEWADDPAGLWTTVDNSFAFLLSDDGVLQQIQYTFPAGTGHRFARIRATRL
jgi:Abnormal spindle-like microcephaly-assoc'd, ASPM-SPD-2-Hydin